MQSLLIQDCFWNLSISVTHRWDAAPHNFTLRTLQSNFTDKKCCEAMYIVLDSSSSSPDRDQSGVFIRERLGEQDYGQ